MLTCVFENGAHGTLRHVVVDAIVLREKSVLLVRRAEGMIEARKWGLVGGFVERDETTIGAVEREVLEETGWSVGPVTVMRINDAPSRPGEDRQNYSFVCFCGAVALIGTPDDESSEQRWWPLDCLPASGELAFDHEEDLQLYRRYLDAPFALPRLG